MVLVMTILFKSQTALCRQAPSLPCSPSHKLYQYNVFSFLEYKGQKEQMVSVHRHTHPQFTHSTNTHSHIYLHCTHTHTVHMGSMINPMGDGHVSL